MFTITSCDQPENKKEKIICKQDRLLLAEYKLLQSYIKYTNTLDNQRLITFVRKEQKWLDNDWQKNCAEKHRIPDFTQCLENRLIKRNRYFSRY